MTQVNSASPTTCTAQVEIININDPIQSCATSAAEISQWMESQAYIILMCSFSFCLINGKKPQYPTAEIKNSFNLLIKFSFPSRSSSNKRIQHIPFQMMFLNVSHFCSWTFSVIVPLSPSLSLWPHIIEWEHRNEKRQINPIYLHIGSKIHSNNEHNVNCVVDFRSAHRKSVRAITIAKKENQSQCKWLSVRGLAKPSRMKSNR